MELIEMLTWLGNALGYAVFTCVVCAGTLWKLIGKKINTIHAQVTPNGGTSMADALARLERTNLAWWHASHEVSDTAVWRTDSQGNTTWVNQACAELFGMDASEMCGRGWVTAIHMEDRSFLMKEWTNAVGDKRTFDCEFRVKNPRTGQVTLVKGHGNPTLIAVDKAGISVLDGFFGSVKPVRVLKHAAIVSCDVNQVIRSWNDAASDLFGWLDTEVIGVMTIDKLVAPSLLDAHMRAFAIACLSAQGAKPVLPHRTIVGRAVDRSGRLMNLEVKLSGHKTLDGEIRFVAKMTEQ